MRTPICLDESITSARVAADAIALGACSIVNIKAGRVGGYLEARRVHNVCVEHGVPVWCGGMLETGLGRAANVALAALPGFTLPGDTSASTPLLRGRRDRAVRAPTTGASPSRPARASASRRSPSSSSASPSRSRPSARPSVVGREQAELQLDDEALLRVLEVELEQLHEAAHPVAERVRMDGDRGPPPWTRRRRRRGRRAAWPRTRCRARRRGRGRVRACRARAPDGRRSARAARAAPPRSARPRSRPPSGPARRPAARRGPARPPVARGRPRGRSPPWSRRPRAARVPSRSSACVPMRWASPTTRRRLELALVLEERVDGLAERDRRRVPEGGLAVDDHEIDEPLALQVVERLLAADELEREDRERRGGGEAEPSGGLLRRAALVEHGQEHLGPHPPLDVPRGAGLDHVRRGDAGGLHERALGLLVEPVLVVDRPRSSRSPGCRRGSRSRSAASGRPCRPDGPRAWTAAPACRRS